MPSIILLSITIIFVSTISTSYQNKLPINTAVKKGSSAVLNCSSVDNTKVYDLSTWTYIASQTGTKWSISQNLTILPSVQQYFQFEGNVDYNLKINKVDESTTGVYECAGFVKNELVDSYSAFLMSIDEKPACQKSVGNLNVDFPNNTQIAYCFSNYSGMYEPKININSANGGDFSGDVYQYANVEKLAQQFVVGGCRLIVKDADFDCQIRFDSPPVNLIPDIGTDVSKPTLAAVTCNKNDADNSPAPLPNWLKERCEKKLVPIDYTKIPKNTAVEMGNDATLVCEDVNKNKHDSAYWGVQTVDGSNSIIANKFGEILAISTPPYFSFPDPEKFTLKVSKVDRFVTGRYECDGIKNNATIDRNQAFLLAMKKPKCSESTTGLNGDSKLVYCYTDYAGSYHPTVNFTKTSDSSFIYSATFDKAAFPLDNVDSQVGGCIVVDRNLQYKCDLKFGPPPQNLIDIDYVVDHSPPNLILSCDSTTEDVPQWLQDQCKTTFQITTPTSTSNNASPILYEAKKNFLILFVIISAYKFFIIYN